MHKREMNIFGTAALAAFLLLAPMSVYGEPDSQEADSQTAVYEDETVSNTNDKNYGIANVNTNLNIRENAGTEYVIVGKLPRDAICYIEGTQDNWSYITSGGVEGYVCTDYLITGVDAQEVVNTTGEENLTLAHWTDSSTPTTTDESDVGQAEPVADAVEGVAEEEQDTVEETAAEVNLSGNVRNELVEFAKQFIGNPYVWGGTSLTDGADCSGFVQSVYAEFGYSLPRVSGDQSQTGERISVEEAQPGDLIFYEENGSIYHVVIYIGDGQVVHASSASTGIKISDVYYENAVWAVRLLD